MDASTQFLTMIGSILLNVGFLYVLFAFRKPIFNSIKLKKLINKGYTIVRFISPDRTVKEEIIKLTDEEIRKNGKIYAIDNEAILLRDRKYPEITFKSDEAEPINYLKEVQEYNAVCTECNKPTVVEVRLPKRMDPTVLNNIVLKATSIGSLLKWLQENKTMMYLMFGCIGAVAVGAYLNIDAITKLTETLTAKFIEICAQKSVIA